MSTGDFGLWMVGTMGGAIGVAVLIASIVAHRRDRLLAKSGQRATGRILAAGCDTDGLGDNTYWIKVEYDDDYTGESITARVVVTRHDQQRYQVGKRLGLTYASRPRAVQLDPPE